MISNNQNFTTYKEPPYPTPRTEFDMMLQKNFCSENTCFLPIKKNIQPFINYFPQENIKSIENWEPLFGFRTKYDENMALAFGCGNPNKMENFIIPNSVAVKPSYNYDYRTNSCNSTYGNPAYGNTLQDPNNILSYYMTPNRII